MRIFLKIIKYNLFLLLIPLLLSGCSNNQESLSSSNLQIYTSIYPIYDFVSKIGGDKVDVYSLIKNGEDAHSFEPTAKDIMNIENSNIVFYNGAGLEDWIDKVQNSISNTTLEFVNLSENISLIKDNHSGDEHSDDEHSSSHYHEYDPHIWLSISNAKIICTTILNKLVELDEENQDYYINNYESLIKDLETLQNSYSEELKDSESREILVTHNAYGYLCNEYNIKQTSISNSIENDESSPAKIIEIINYIKENNIKYIITDGLSSQKVAENITNETGAEILILNTLESLSEDDLNNNEDYISIMYKNLEILKLALS